MANLPQQDTIKQYLADGVQANFAVPFFVPLEIDGQPNIDVYVQLAGDTPVPESDIKVWGVDYTFTTNLDPITGGILNFLTGKIPADGSVVTIVRDVQASLDVEFSNAANFSGANLDDALDKLLLIEQQNKTYCLQRNLSYVVNSYLPDASLLAQVQIPVLGDNQIWMGTGLGVVAVTLQQGSDVSTLRSELANNAPVTNGAHLVGYYDTVNLVPTTVKAFLDNLSVHSSNFNANYGDDTGTLNNLVANNALGASLLYAGLQVSVTVANTNTSNVTLNWNGLGARPVDFNGSNLPAGYIVATLTYDFIYNGTNWSIINPTIRLATNAETIAGTDAIHPVTAAGLASGVSLTQPGFMKLPGGLIMQWGISGVIAPNGSAVVGFGVGFLSGALIGQATVVNNTSGVNSAAAISTLTTTSMTVYNTTQAGAGNVIHWFVLGV